MVTDWDRQMMEECLAEVEKRKTVPGMFSISAISNVPYISFPGFSETECLEVQQQIRNVLRFSRSQNNYKEVAITYDLSKDKKSRQYFKVFGDYTSIPLMSDEDTKALLVESNENRRLVVISIHNHPNNSEFSINDLLVFSKNPGIKLMAIVNGQGNVSFLLRPYEIDISNVVFPIIAETAKDFQDRVVAFHEKTQSHDYKIQDLLSSKEITEVVRESIFTMELFGVYYSDYIDQEQSNSLSFSPPDKVMVLKAPKSNDAEHFGLTQSSEADYDYG